MSKRSEPERLYRDVPAGTIHPANSMLVHEIVGKSALGVLGELLRWGRARPRLRHQQPG